MSRLGHLSLYPAVLKFCKNSVRVDGENETERGKRPDPRKNKTNYIYAVFKVAKPKSPA